MSKFMVHCFSCRTKHDLNRHKFPLLVHRPETIEKDGKKTVIQKLIGYLCRKCTAKHTVVEELKNNFDLAKRRLSWRRALAEILKPKMQIK